MVSKNFFYSEDRLQCYIGNGSGNKRHMHVEVELIYMIKGKTKAKYNLSEFVLSAGDFILISPNTIHAFDIIDDTENIVIIFDKNMFPQYNDFFENNLVFENPVINKNVLHEEVEFCMEQIINRKELQTFGIDIENEIQNIAVNKIKAYVMLVLENIIEKLAIRKSEITSNFEWISKAVYYINENYTKHIDLFTMAKSLGISKNYLSKKFNSILGLSIVDYTNKLRVHRAMELLETTDLTITEISLQSGFESSATYYRIFKSMQTESPRKYRKNFRDKD